MRTFGATLAVSAIAIDPAFAGLAFEPAVRKRPKSRVVAFGGHG
jgi:hypothetical protein